VFKKFEKHGMKDCIFCVEVFRIFGWGFVKRDIDLRLVDEDVEEMGIVIVVWNGVFLFDLMNLNCCVE
ncbi:hypothetical protein, partial [Siminovitchia fortis]|uniref:hypothetical protein n=1 Tax=Siminovitchia fortis TaxID=254758 RepID=UPI001C92C45A